MECIACSCMWCGLGRGPCEHSPAASAHGRAGDGARPGRGPAHPQLRSHLPPAALGTLVLPPALPQACVLKSVLVLFGCLQAAAVAAVAGTACTSPDGAGPSTQPGPRAAAQALAGSGTPVLAGEQAEAGAQAIVPSATPEGSPPASPRARGGKGTVRNACLCFAGWGGVRGGERMGNVC